MPAYEYDCAQCGGFTAIRPMSASGDPQTCPGCGEMAPRAILTAPAFAGMPAASRIAHATNERARHEPKQSSKHGAGCGCCSGARKPAAAAAADGVKSFPSKRPWMISH
jgi:putative FmdB family regulatory protein